MDIRTTDTLQKEKGEKGRKVGKYFFLRRHLLYSKKKMFGKKLKFSSKENIFFGRKYFLTFLPFSFCKVTHVRISDVLCGSGGQSVTLWYLLIGSGWRRLAEVTGGGGVGDIWQSPLPTVITVYVAMTTSPGGKHQHFNT